MNHNNSHEHHSLVQDKNGTTLRDTYPILLGRLIEGIQAVVAEGSNAGMNKLLCFPLQ